MFPPSPVKVVSLHTHTRKKSCLNKITGRALVLQGKIKITSIVWVCLPLCDCVSRVSQY